MLDMKLPDMFEIAHIILFARPSILLEFKEGVDTNVPLPL